MNIEFTPNEARVIGCLIEKETTTPDQYPLSLNALTNACNQKTNREPVLELSETVVQQAVDSLMKKYMVSDKSAGYGGPGDQIPAPFLQHRVRTAEVLAPGARHTVRAAAARPADAGGIALADQPVVRVRGRAAGGDDTAGAHGARGWPLRRPLGALCRRTRGALRSLVLRDARMDRPG